MDSADLHRRLITLFPEFESFWDSDENYFLRKDGTFTPCGVFARFGDFIRGNHRGLATESLDELGHLLEDCLSENAPSDLFNAATTCFLENVDGENFTRDLAMHFGTKARAQLQNLS